MSPHSATEAERVSPPTRIQLKPPQTESICLPAAGGAAAGYFHLFMFSPRVSCSKCIDLTCVWVLYLHAGSGSIKLPPTAAAPAGQSPAPPRVSFFGASPLWVLHNKLLHRTKRGEQSKYMSFKLFTVQRR